MKLIKMSRKTTMIVAVVCLLLFAYHMFDIFIMRDHLQEMWEYDAKRLPISHICIEYNRNDGERMLLYDTTEIQTVSDMVKYSNEYTRKGWKYYRKPKTVVPVEFYSYEYCPNTNKDYLVATAYIDDTDYLITKLKLGPSNKNFSYTLKDFDGLFEDIEELEITNLCLFRDEDVDGLINMTSLKTIYIHDNPSSDLTVACAIKHRYPNLNVFYGPFREEVTIEMAND